MKSKRRNHSLPKARTAVKSDAAPAMRTLGVIDQIAQATKPSYRLSLIAGFLLGGFIPTASYIIAHFEARSSWPLWTLVAAGLAYSALTVFEWARIAFKHPVKALGFVILTEGVMVFSASVLLSYAALTLLVFVNGTATACTLIADMRLKRKRS